MKNNIFFSVCFLLLITLLSCGEQDPLANADFKWYTIEEAAALNKNKKRKYFVDVYTEWCGWCKRMDATTFSDQEIKNYLQQHFIPIKLDAEQKEKITFLGKHYSFDPNIGRRGVHELAVDLLKGRMSYPSFAFLDENGALVNVSKGFKKPAEFMIELKFVGENHYQSTSIQAFKNQQKKQSK